MRPNNRQRSRGGRNGGGGGGGSHNQHKQHHNHNPNRPPNRNQIFDSSGPDVRVRGNAHQVFDKYQALAREAAASGDRIAAEAYWQYADHYFRVIQTMGGFVPRGNQGWGDGTGEDGQQQGNPQQGPPNGHQQANGSGEGNEYERDEPPPYRQQGEPQQHRQQGERQHGDRQQGERQQGDRQQGDRQQGERQQSELPQNRQQGEAQALRQQGEPPPRRQRNEDQRESDPGLGGVAFLQTGRSTPVSQDPADDEQPEVPEFVPAGAGRRR
jgi:hypothetical protein